MGIEELKNMDANKVRNNSSLMRLYIEIFEQTFGYKPNCAGCTFKKDFQKLINSKKTTTTLKTTTMKKTFKLKRITGRILTYKINGRPIRKYDNKLTEDFVIGYLTHGTEQELEERRKQFEILPKLAKKEEVKQVIDFSKMSKKQLITYAQENNIELDESLTKKEIIELWKSQQM